MDIIKRALRNHDPFDLPYPLTRVTAGAGGESFFIDGEKMCAIYDCGMAYCHDNLIKNIEKQLTKSGKDRLDFVFMSHSHYDHIGALPYIVERWPDVRACGAEKIEKVFKSNGARNTMKRLGTVARDRYSSSKEEICVDGMRIDIILKDGDTVDLGEVKVRAVETKGHTDCSMSYMIQPAGIMLASESTGILRFPTGVDTAILKSFDDTVKSAEKCKAIKPKHVITNHFGIIPDSLADIYFNLYIEAAEKEKNFILDLHNSGLCKQEIIYAYRDKHWTIERGKSQPEEAFLENAGYIVDHIIANCGEI